MTDQDLALNEERLKMVLEGSELGFWDWNLESGEVKRNDRWAQILGYSTIGEFEDNTDTWTNSIHPDDRDAAWESISNHKDGLTDSHKMEYRMLTKDGSYRWVLDQAKIVQRDINGRALRMSGTHSDISERRKLEEERDNLIQSLQVSEERLKQEVHVKNKFFTIIAHDLKSPIISLLARTQTISQMANGYSKEKLVELATDLNEDGNRVFRLLRNLLEWSRLQMEVTKQKPKMIQLAELTKESIDILNSTALVKNISLTNNINSVCVFADHDMVRTVILNLITNSIKFSLPGGSVGISASNEGKMVQVTVTDTGIGMTEDQIKKVFYLDQETSTIGTDGERGTGLGLPLCKEIIERNKGEIWIESVPGEETCIHFTLPVGSR